MWQYKTSVAWKGGKEGELNSAGKPPIIVATPPEFGGPPGQWTPEDFLTNAVAGCLMTSALYYFGRAKLDIRAYTCNAVGTMDKGPTGLVFTGVEAKLRITAASPDQVEGIRQAVGKAEKSCPISNTLNCPVTVDLEVDSA